MQTLLLALLVLACIPLASLSPPSRSLPSSPPNSRNPSAFPPQSSSLPPPLAPPSRAFLPLHLSPSIPPSHTPPPPVSPHTSSPHTSPTPLSPRTSSPSLLPHTSSPSLSPHTSSPSLSPHTSSPSLSPHTSPTPLSPRASPSVLPHTSPHLSPPPPSPPHTSSPPFSPRAPPSSPPHTSPLPLSPRSPPLPLSPRSPPSSAYIHVGTMKSPFMRYAVQDEMVEDGVTFWQKYVNSLVPNSFEYEVEVTNQDSYAVTMDDACHKLVTDDDVDLIVGPFGQNRLYNVLNVTRNSGRVILGTSGEDTLFDSEAYFSATPRYSSPSPSLKLVASRAKSFMLFLDSLHSDSVATTIQYLTSRNLALHKSYVIKSATALVQQEDMNAELANAIEEVKDAANGSVSDLFIVAVGSTSFPLVRTALQVAKFPFKLAIFLNPTMLLPSYETKDADGWLTDVLLYPTDPNSPSAKFNSTYIELMGKPPSALAAITVANLCTYWEALKQINDTNCQALRAKMFELAPFSTCGALHSINGSISYTAVEYYSGEAHAVDESTFLYPATSYSPPAVKGASSSSDEGAGLLAGIILAVVFFLVLLIALGLTVIRRQRNKVHEAIIQAEEGQRRTYKIDFESLETHTLIGTGSFGYVYSGTYRGAEVAVKKLKQQYMTAQEAENFLRESAVMVGLRHPNILLFMGVCTTAPDMCIVTELLPRGSLFSVLHNDNIKLPFRVCIRMALDVLRGLQFIHMTGFIHRDLKSPNLLVDKDWNIKIADFGLSCTTAYVEDDGHISLLWAAPEVLVGEKNCYSEKSDIYSFGIVLWEIISRKTPYETLSTSSIMKRVVNGHRPPIDQDWNPSVVQVMTSSWEAIASNRATILNARKILEGIEEESSLDADLPNNVPDLTPPPPTTTVTLVFMDIYNSTALWEAFPLVMASAMRIYNQLVHKFVNSEKGFEVANSGSAYVIAFPEVHDAVNFCLRLQVAMMKAQWPDTLIQHPDAKRERVYRRGKEEVVLRGLRVRMGVHTCSPTYYRNPLTNSIDYSGPGVEMAARLVDDAQGGQTLMTKEMHTVVMEDAGRQHPRIDGFYAESIGQTSIGDLFQVVPKDYFGRIGFFKTRSAFLTQTPYGSSSNLPQPTRLPPLTADAKRTRSLLGENPWILNFSDLVLGTSVGAGSYGTVHQATYQGKPVAVKIFTKQTYSDQIMLQMRGESAMSIKLDHPNVIKFMGLIVEPPTIGLVTEFVDNGNLAELLFNRKNEISWKRRVKIARDIATGMIYLHSCKIVNCDLKATNILLTRDWVAKIGDFGFNETKLENHSMTQCGNIAHTAPEIFQESFPTEQSDVYSFGIILWQIIFRTRPWEGAHTMKIINSVEIGLRPSLEQTPPDTPIHIINLMQDCWHPDPTRRPVFSEIVVKLNTSVP